jgi:hypothetical protein
MYKELRMGAFVMGLTIGVLVATLPASVVLEHLQRRGYEGGKTILKDYLRKVRPLSSPADSRQRTSYAPGEIGQFGCWHLPIEIPVGKDRYRKPYGLVASLPPLVERLYASPSVFELPP